MTPAASPRPGICRASRSVPGSRPARCYTPVARFPEIQQSPGLKGASLRWPPASASRSVTSIAPAPGSRRGSGAPRSSPSPSLSALGSARISLKLEAAQDTGAFKLRGATNFIRASDDVARAPGVVTISTGNHGRAVAHAAQRIGVRVVVCMSELVPRHKREAIEALGAEARISGPSQDEAEAEAQRLVAEEGLVLVHPFDDPLVIAGQGTIGPRDPGGFGPRSIP